MCAVIRNAPNRDSLSNTDLLIDSHLRSSAGIDRWMWLQGLGLEQPEQDDTTPKPVSAKLRESSAAVRQNVADAASELKQKVRARQWQLGAVCRLILQDDRWMGFLARHLHRTI